MKPLDSHSRTVALEICTQSLEDSLHSAAKGAARVELNSAIDLGGLTPSIGLMELVVDALRPTGCQVIAMVRPRPGGFNYTPSDLGVMARDIEQLLAAGVHGVAFGVLDESSQVSIEANHNLIEPVLAAGREAVFHRAFDVVTNKQQAIESLIEIGFHRVLTSGGKPSAIDGSTTIRDCIQWADGRIEILPGGGITPANVHQLIQATGCDQVHASLRSLHDDGSIPNDSLIEFNAAPLSGSAFKSTDAESVDAMMHELKQHPVKM